jgi:two-component system chemotaxis response regulator CheB
MLSEILTRAGRMPAAHPTDGETIQYGRIYIAPPDNHMLIDGNHVRVVRTASENGLGPRSIRSSV